MPSIQFFTFFEGFSGKLPVSRKVSLNSVLSETLFNFLSQLFKQFRVVFMEKVQNLTRIQVFLTRF